MNSDELSNVLKYLLDIKSNIHGNNNYKNSQTVTTFLLNRVLCVLK